MFFLENRDGSIKILKETNDDFDQQASEGELIVSSLLVIGTDYSIIDDN